MKKLIITEEEKNHIRNLHEQKRKLSAKQLGISVDNTSNTTMPSSTTTYGLTPQTSTYVPETNPENKTENLNPKNLKVGDGGKNNPQKKNDVIELQNKLISLGCLKTDTGKATGYFGSKTDAALKLYQTKGSCKAVNTVPKKEEKPTQKLTSTYSQQVDKQINYLKTNNLLKNEKFTVVDDKSSKVYAFNPNYELYKSYDVITGKDRGDKLKTQTMTDWVMKNWKNVFSKVFESGFQDTANYIDNCYFGQKEWEIKNTPSGVFKRAGIIKNFMNDFLATTFIEEDYGKRFITWETCDGETIPFGFHGTQSSARVKILDLKNNKNQSCTKRKMSFGCINFKENDILDINNFITSGQLSIWLPDKTNDIIQIPQQCL